MTKSGNTTQQSVRMTRSSTKRASAAKVPGRAALGDISNKRSTRSSHKKSVDTYKRVPVVAKRRSARKSGDSQQQADAKKGKASKSANRGVDGIERNSGRLKRQHDSNRDDTASKKKKQKTSRDGEVKTVAEVEKHRSRRHQKSHEVLHTKNAVPVRGRSAQRALQAAMDATSKPRSRSSRRQTGKDKTAYKPQNSDGTRSSPVRTRSRSSSRRSGVASGCKPGALCSDFLRNSDYGLVRVPFDSSKYTFGIAAHDAPNRDDVLAVSPYVTDIFQRLYHAEGLTSPGPYLQRQPHLNVMMRAILIDWIVEVHMKFRLTAPTLYLCVNIIDRYLNLVSVIRERLQLVGVTALLIACKYEEIYPPEVRDCVYITDRAYSRQDVLDMEQEIVKRLEFKMTVPTGHPFLQRFLSMTHATETVSMVANYYMERVLQEHEMLDYRPSLIAAAAVCLALNNPDVREFDKQFGPKPGMPDNLLKHTGFIGSEIVTVARKISVHVSWDVTTQSGRELVAVKKKYESDKYNRLSARFSDPTVEDLFFMHDDSDEDNI